MAKGTASEAQFVPCEIDGASEEKENAPEQERVTQAAGSR